MSGITHHFYISMTTYKNVAHNHKNKNTRQRLEFIQSTFFNEVKSIRCEKCNYEKVIVNWL